MNSTAARASRPIVIAGITAALRVIVVAAAEVAAFYLLPLNANRRVSGVVLAVVGASLLVVVLGLQVWAITRSPLPEVRAIEALAGFITLLLVGFAGGYYMLSSAATSNFTQTLTRTDALYFTTTVFSTVGFGDITPVGETARVLVTSQMVLDLVVLGAGLKIVGGAVKLGRERRDRQGPTGTSPTEPPAGLTELQGGDTRS
jgi:voltage-gated potassium channel